MKLNFTIRINILTYVLAILSFPAMAEEDSWIGYYEPSDKLCEFGTGIAESYDCCIYLPGNVGFASGKSLKGLRFALQGTKETANLKVWISSRLPESAENADFFVADIPAEDLEDGGMTEIMVDTPVWVDGDGVYVGYSFDTSDPFPILVSPGSTTVENGFFIKSSKSYKEWKNLSPFKNGNLAIEVLVDGKSYVNAACIKSAPELVAYPDSNVEYPLYVTNLGRDGMTSVEYSLFVDDEDCGTFEYTFPEPVDEIRETGVVPVRFRSASHAGISYLDFSIVKVNGQYNEIYDSVTQRGGVVTVDESMPRRVVMEEFTGTWCGWCPRGMVALEKLSEDFGDGFIGIAVHQNDPMTINGYSTILESVHGFPSARINRGAEFDPYYGSKETLDNKPPYGIKEDIENEFSMLTPASIFLETVWVDKAAMKFDINTFVTLNYERLDNPAYRVAYVVLADSLYGDTPLWFQNNDFALPISQKFKDDPYLGWLTEEGQMIRNIKYNDVAIDVYGIEDGFELESEGVWKRGERKMVGSISVDLSDNPLVQDIDNLSVVALLLDAVSGIVVNGSEIRVSDSSSVEKTVIPDRENVSAVIYGVDGQKRERPTKGINIIRYSDGRVNKIFVK